MKILIVEDNLIGTMLLEILLHKHGYQTVLARTGTAATPRRRLCTTVAPALRSGPRSAQLSSLRW